MAEYMSSLHDFSGVDSLPVTYVTGYSHFVPLGLGTYADFRAGAQNHALICGAIVVTTAFAS